LSKVCTVGEGFDWLIEYSAQSDLLEVCTMGKGFDRFIERTTKNNLSKVYTVGEGFDGLIKLSAKSNLSKVYTVGEGFDGLIKIFTEIICLLGQNGCGKSTFIEMLAGNISHAHGSLKESGVSYKKQNTDEFRDFEGTVQDLLESTINKSLVDTFFRLIVLKSLNIEQLEHLPVKSLSGGERQRVAITICLGTPAMIYLIDEPSADLDCEQRLIVAKVIKRWIINHLGRSCFLIEHDFMMSSTLADKIIVYEGILGVKCTAMSPVGSEEGFNRFLKQLNVTFRQKKANCRLRINKRNSILDRQQKHSGQYYIFNDD
jgi:ATP-binding cassette subfamily E protein 1